MDLSISYAVIPVHVSSSGVHTMHWDADWFVSCFQGRSCVKTGAFTDCEKARLIIEVVYIGVVLRIFHEMPCVLRTSILQDIHACLQTVCRNTFMSHFETDLIVSVCLSACLSPGF